MGPPGPTGAAGAAGATGATGPQGLIGPPGWDAEPPDEPLMIPGPTGATGPAGAGGSDPPEGSYAPGSYTIATGKFRIAVMRQQFTGSQRLTVQGTGRLSIRN